ncbi:MAG: hypothetical protein WEG36_10525 [Gemmatimonadota bacterium]
MNSGTAAVGLDGATLSTDAGAVVNLPQSITLEPGALLVVSFDDQSGSGDGVMHVPAADFPAGESGAVRLDLPDGVADAVVWGQPDLASVDLCRGGRCSPPAPGSVLARLPEVTNAFAPAAWAPLDPARATPGQPNPRPVVSMFAALPGMIFTGRPRFSWYSVPGAASYRLQVGSGDAFAAVVHEEQIEGTPGVRLEQLAIQGPELPPGSYVWRVQALGGGGEPAEFSEALPFRVDPSRTVPEPARASAEREVGGDDQQGTTAAGGSPTTPTSVPEGLLRVLDVPVIAHAKDTRMLALEAPHENPLWSWDTPDFAGYPYCARAGVAMLNAFYGGGISQDRIGYEVFRDLRDGPEYDLPIIGITDDRTTRYSLPLAIGTSGQYERNPYNARGFDLNACVEYAQDLALQQCASQCADPQSEECLRCRIAREPEIQCPAEIAHRWGMNALVDIQREIDAGRPVIATNPGHLFLFVGYRSQDGDFFLFYQDQHGRQEMQADAAGLSRYLYSYWIGLAPVEVRSDEAEVDSDSDGDGVVDFDEIHRFRTDASTADSDGDGIGDKEEIRASVWDPQNGYHRSVEQLTPTGSPDDAAARAMLGGRDFDRDGVAMELDVDSDGGGCRDGAEDENFNGLRDGNERYNFDGGDDDCDVALGGRIEMSYAFVPGWPAECQGTVDLRLRFALEPDPENVTDDSPVALVYDARQAEYEISTEGCEDIVDDGFLDELGVANVACSARGGRRSAVIAFGEESNSYLTFFPLDPELGLLLTGDALLNLTGECVNVDGRVSDFSILFLGGEALTVGSGLDCDPDASRLSFCVEPTACNVTAGSQPLDCHTRPDRYAVLPFRGSLTKQGDIREMTNSADAHVRWEICNGCGDRFFD